MKLVLDTKLLISALLTKNTPPHQHYQAWVRGLFNLVSSDWQLEELKQVLGFAKLRPFIWEHEASLLIENLDSMAILFTDLVPIEASPDPDDNWIIATAIAGEADMIVSGDKSDLPALVSVQDVEIVNPRTALESLI